MNRNALERRLRPGEAAPDATVLTPAGQISLASLWADRPIVLSFLRHFG